MNNGLKIQRCNFLPEGEMAIVKDTNTLIHNIVDSELKEKDKEIERLNNIIDELEKYIKENSIYYNTSDGCQWVDQFKVLDKLNELKDKNE